MRHFYLRRRSSWQYFKNDCSLRYHFILGSIEEWRAQHADPTDEFDSSTSINSFYEMGLSPEGQEKYHDEILRRRILAHEREMQQAEAAFHLPT